MGGGYIKIHRKMVEWQWWDDPVMVKVWLQLLFDASYEDKEWLGVKIGRGQLTVGRRAYAERCGISERHFRTCMNRLKATNEVTTQTTNKYTLVTICQYDSYQTNELETPNQTPNQTPTNAQPTPSQRPLTKKGKKVNELKEDNTLSLSLSSEMEEAAKGFIEMRTRIKKPLNQNALDLMLKKLDGMASTEQGKIAILNESIMNSWQGIFFPKNNASAKPVPKRDNFEQREYDDEFFDKIANASLKQGDRHE